jgi:hypothetical protein
MLYYFVADSNGSKLVHPAATATEIIAAVAALVDALRVSGYRQIGIVYNGKVTYRNSGGDIITITILPVH